MRQDLNICRFLFALLIPLCCMISCADTQTARSLDMAETIMEEHPDSAYSILSGIDTMRLKTKSQKARYALLMSMALDKNYIDTTTFDVLQPAIDHYLSHGTPDEKLKTYYYQGCIYQNQGDKDRALNSFVKGSDLAGDCKDSLALARLFMAQGTIYKVFFDLDSYINCNLKAGEIYRNLSLRDRELDCLINALNGSIISEKQQLADSVLSFFKEFNSFDDRQKQALFRQKILYSLKFGTENEIRDLLSKEKLILNTSNDVLNLAIAYNKLGDYNEAARLLQFFENTKSPYDTLRYMAVSVPILEGLGKYNEALSMYKRFIHIHDSLTLLTFAQKSQSIEEKHLLELKAQEEARSNSHIIWSCIGGIIFLILGIIILLLVIRSHKNQKRLALHETEKAQLETEKLRSEKELSDQKAKNVQLENERLRSEKELSDQKAKNVQLENEKLRSEKKLSDQISKNMQLENENLKAEKALDDQISKNIQLENEKLKTEKERLALENENLQLERDNKALEAENLAHRVSSLEAESERLKELMETPNDMPKEIKNSIRIRLGMLNSLLASHISANPKYEKPYDLWVKELTADTQKFMDTNRLAFQASHPKLIHFFEKHDLTTDEINYLCLYAIGLRGKEIGIYIKRPSHINMSSDIRKKLGIDKHDTNIGIYVKNLLKEL